MWNARRKAQIAMGLPVEAAPSGPTEDELQQRAKGLQSLLVDAQEVVKDRQGKYRAAVHDLVRVCAERCAVDYADATRRQAWCYQQIAIAQTLIGSYKPLFTDFEWGKYFVPGSEGLPALKGKSRDEFFIPALMSADRIQSTIKAATAELRARCVELFGECPL